MKFIQTPILGVVVMEPVVHGDHRGFFMETYREDLCRKNNIPVNFVQDNFSRSVYGTLRALHSQNPYSQGKLVRVVQGEVFDVAVDIRVGSPTFLKWHGEVLSSENRKQMYIPEGFAHGFCVLSEFADFEYKCTSYYAPEYELSIRWNDPEIDIKWPAVERILSEKDRMAPLLCEIPETKLPKY